MAENEIIKEVKKEIQEVGNNKSSLLKTLATITTPILIAALGIAGNSKYMAWRMDNVEKQVGTVEKKIDDVAKQSDKTNELLIQFLINRGYTSAKNYAKPKPVDPDGSQVDMYFAYKAQQLKEEKEKKEPEMKAEAKAEEAKK